MMNIPNKRNRRSQRQNGPRHTPGILTAAVLLLALLLALLPQSASVHAREDLPNTSSQPLQTNAAAKLHSVLLDLVQSGSDRQVPVIVQAKGSFDDLLRTVAWNDSLITGELHFINAVTAIVPVRGLLTIAASPAVRWISPDGPMVNAAFAAASTPATAWNEIQLADTSASDVSLVLQPVMDASITSARPDNNFGGKTTLGINSAYHTLMQFDLSSIPTDASIIGAKLVMLRTGGTQSPHGVIKVHAVMESWQEGTQSDDSCSDGVTWASRDCASAATWSMAGGTFAPQVLGSSPIIAGQNSWDVTQLVKIWAAGRLENNGLLMQVAGGSETHTFSSREGTAPPQLYITYSPAVSTDDSPTVPPLELPPLDVASNATIEDDFAVISFSNNSGTHSWANGWVENDPNNGGAGPAVGHVQIAQGQLSLKDYPNTGGYPSAARQVDLSNAESAVLSFDFATTWGVDLADAVALEISPDGVDFVPLEVFTKIEGASSGSRVYDISGFRSDMTTIRFRVVSMYGAGYEQFLIDNVKIAALLPAGSYTAPPDSTQPPISQATVRDDFTIKSNNNNDGSRLWTSIWNEILDDGDTSGGEIVIDGNGHLEMKMDGTFGKSIARTANLAGANSAALRYYLLDDSNLEDDQAVTVEASKDGGSSWVTLTTINASTAEDQLYTYDLVSLLGSTSANTVIRFRHSAGNGSKKVRLDYVEIDYTYQASIVDPVFITWASALGTATDYEWFDAANIFDENGFGPDGIYGYGADGKAAFGGFSAEVTPGNAISKVELLLSGYARTQIPDEEFKFKVYVNGSKESEFKLPSSIFDDYVGASNAGTVVIDLTDSYEWKWLAFSSNLEIFIEHKDFKDDEDEYIHYDGIGLRVTSMPGVDNSLDAASTTTSSKEAFDTSRLSEAFPFAVRAAEVWNESPAYLQGQDITAAIIDSGVGKVKDLGSRKLRDVNFNRGYHDGKDKYGHGTFVAGVLAGDGKHSKGTYTGIAPKVNLVNVRVSDDAGMSTEGDVLQALQWVFENAEEYNIRVVNLSLNSAVAQSYHTSPLVAGVEMLWLRGIVVVASAGNNGSADLYPPANSPRVITVGATDDLGTPGLVDDVVAHFSAWGTDETGAVKPDLVAPGTNIIAYVPSNGKLTMGKEHAENALNKDYFRMSGTSMAAPIVAGAVTMLLQDEPMLTPDQVKFRLKATANKDWPGYDAAKAGAGYLDIYAAVHGTSTEYANVGVAPSELLRPLVGHILGDDFLSGTGFTWNTVNWNSVNWNSVNWNSVNWNSNYWTSGFTWSSVNWNSVNWNSVNWNSVNWNSVNWNSDYWDGSFTAASAGQDYPDPEEGVEEINQTFLFLPAVENSQ